MPNTKPKFAKLTLDFTFKKIFASENKQSEGLLISLIESFLKEYLIGKIKDIKLLPTEQANKTKKQRAAVFDLHCTDNNGNRFIVEMQIAKQDFFLGRILFYISQAITIIAKKGRKYKFDLPKIYSLSFINFEPDFEDRNRDVVRHIGLTDLKHPEKRYGNIHMALVMLTRFKKSLKQCKTTMDLWLWLFKNLHKQNEIPARFKKTQFKSVFDIAEISNFNRGEFIAYEAGMKCDDVYDATIAYAKKRGVLETAKSMLKDGLGLARVARITKLPKEQIMALM